MWNGSVVVIGGSAGALEALRVIVSRLAPDFPAAVFVALHTSPQAHGMLDQVLARAGRLPSRYAADYEPIEGGRIYLAPPDRHLVVKRDHVRVTRGPRENRFRPAVDPLFRTAAAAHGARVAAVVLSGGQDDGAVGLGIVRDHGGLTVVQDPADALVPGMPDAAIRHTQVEHIVAAADIPAVLTSFVERVTVPAEDEAMARDLPNDPAEGGGHFIHRAGSSGVPPSPFTCPECGGTLWQTQRGQMLQFNCHLGHRFSGDTLAVAQMDVLEYALWAGLRALEEASELRRRMARHAQNRGMVVIASSYEAQAFENEQRAEAIRRVLMPETRNDVVEEAADAAAPSARRGRRKDR